MSKATSLRQRISGLIEENVKLLRVENSTLSKAEAIAKFLETPAGAACYELYQLGLERRESSETFRPENVEPVSMDSDEFHREILERAKSMVQKSAGMSLADALTKLMNEDPELYELYKSVTVV